jgi:hypothetical protein
MFVCSSRSAVEKRCVVYVDGICGVADVGGGGSGGGGGDGIGYWEIDMGFERFLWISVRGGYSEFKFFLLFWYWGFFGMGYGWLGLIFCWKKVATCFFWYTIFVWTSVRGVVGFRGWGGGGRTWVV